MPYLSVDADVPDGAEVAFGESAERDEVSLMIAFARTCDAIATTGSRLDKIALVADYLRGLGDTDLAAAARFFTGNPFPARDERARSVGGRTLIAAARTVWGVDDAALHAAYRRSGDLGRALGPLVRPPADLGLFRETLTPAVLRDLLDRIAAANGKNAQRRRHVLCERVLGACTEPLEATYVLKILTGELRIGLREGLILDAIATAFGREPAAVRRAASAAGDVGAVALAARHDTLATIAIAYLSPLAFMLATPIPYGGDYAELRGASWVVEDKYETPDYSLIPRTTDAHPFILRAFLSIIARDERPLAILDP